MGFSRQEHQNGVPLPSPMHASEKWKWSRSVVSDSSGPHGLQATRLLRPWDSPGKSTGVGCHCLLPFFPSFPFCFLPGLILSSIPLRSPGLCQIPWLPPFPPTGGSKIFCFPSLLMLLRLLHLTPPDRQRTGINFNQICKWGLGLCLLFLEYRYLRLWIPRQNSQQTKLACTDLLE